LRAAWLDALSSTQAHFPITLAHSAIAESNFPPASCTAPVRQLTRCQSMGAFFMTVTPVDTPWSLQTNLEVKPSGPVLFQNVYKNISVRSNAGSLMKARDQYKA
jgi:hypothetical protein